MDQLKENQGTISIYRKQMSKIDTIQQMQD